ncbi:MAG: SbcC/MukB-like Walker B domain-containing protein [Bacteroidota bacterium]
MSNKNGSIDAGGYRLQYIEIYNWGTFDQKIWRLKPNCKNSLLTGANGSGKTTLVDAIITLLVPPGKRHYNQSSGTTSKRERNEKTYTLGAYVTVQSESGLAAKTKHLRTKDDFSILLGVFYNPATKDYCSLAQVRWFSNNDLKKGYFIAPTALTVEEHFIPLDTGGVWKKTLKKNSKAEEFDSFTKYQQVFSKRFGLKSDKALTLFAQTVGIKVLGNLNEFIRTNMLEEHDAEGEFMNLREHYENLLSAHQAIEKAREQANLLQPIVENGEQFHQLEKEVQHLTQLQESITPFFAKKKKALLQESLKSLNNDIKKRENQLVDIRQEIARQNNQKTDLQVAISTDKVYEQVQNLDKQIQQAEREQAQQKNRANRYNQLAGPLGFKIDPNEKTFYKALNDGKKEIANSQTQLDEIRANEVDLQIELNGLKRQEDTLTEQLVSLQKRTNRIPLAQVRVRKAILEKLDLAEATLPFAAELIKIKEGNADWETPIEQVLRPLGMTLLVPTEYFDAVLGYVHRGKLDGKISFRKVGDVPFDKVKTAKKSILQKVEIKQNHAFTNWLEHTIANEYNFIAEKGHTHLAQHRQSVTDRGTIKNHASYERDDSVANKNTSWHILGWDNKASIRTLKEELTAIEQEIKQVQQTIKNNGQNRQRISSRKDQLTRFIGFEQFGEIDWKTAQKNVKQYQAEKEKLVNSSNQLQELENQLAAMVRQIAGLDTDRDRLIEQKSTLQSRYDNYQQQLKETENTLSGLSNTNLSPFQAKLEELTQDENLVVSTIDKAENKINRTVGQQFTDKSKELSKVEKRLSLSMQRFITPTPTILEKYPNWTSDTINFQPDNKYLPEFKALYDKIRQEDLPKYQKRFKDWLNERLIFDIANFKTSLENKEVQILESVDEINSSLKDIHFNSTPLTYIQLDIHKSRDIAVREFKEMLKDAMPDPAKLIQGDEVELEKSFKRIKKIIEELTNNEPWRKKVTDVRNWLEFAAIERFRADDQQRQYYVDSQSLSGGEKAKLAYTILASAIAYQFGIRNQNNRRKSFRFAVVDEAFSKVDPENSVYAMELFKQLNLQLMVVTPLDKINLAEPYIHAVHYVQNKAKKNSEVFDMPMAIYEQKKRDFREE